MTDPAPRPSLAPRLLMGVVAPATNTTVQIEMEALRPPGVLNAHARIANPDALYATEAASAAIRAAMVDGLMGAIDTLTPCHPDHIVIGVMVENFTATTAEGEALIEAAEVRAGCPVTATTHAIIAALRALGARRIGVLTPFFPPGDAAARRFLEEAGFDVVQVIGLRAQGPAAIAALPADRIEAAVRELAATDTDALLQVGTNLAFAHIALAAEAELGRPVVASNPAAYWRALRRAGIMDRLPGAGLLFARA